MDNLFIQLFEAISNSEKIMRNALNNLTEETIQNQQPTDRQLKKWLSLIDEIVERKQKLLKAVKLGVANNYREVDIEIDFFRTIARYLGGFMCFWSKDMKLVEKRNRDIFFIVCDIDEKYNFPDC